METLGVFGVLALWAAIGFLPAWLALVPERGRSLGAVVVAPATGVAAGALVPAMGGRDLHGFAVSLVAALAAGTLVCGIAALLRRLEAERL